MRKPFFKRFISLFLLGIAFLFQTTGCSAGGDVVDKTEFGEEELYPVTKTIADFKYGVAHAACVEVLVSATGLQYTVIIDIITAGGGENRVSHVIL